jgi:hypothetical protein
LYTQWNAFPKRKAELSTWGLLTTTTTCAWLLLQKQSLCPLKLQNTQFALGVRHNPHPRLLHKHRCKESLTERLPLDSTCNTYRKRRMENCLQKYSFNGSIPLHENANWIC